VKALQSCELCPRGCGVDRGAGERGFCRAGVETEVYRYGPHHGEEPPLSGTAGSGTVFFSRCTLHCLYCQNYPWSQQGDGTRYALPALTEVFRELHAGGCHNWNLVSPTPWLPQVRHVVDKLATAGIRLPVVYNTSGFEAVDTLAGVEDLADIYLTDLRYADPVSAHEGSGRSDYVDVARAALQVMWQQKGALQLDADGIATRGTICRLLILPGRAGEVVDNLTWLADTIGPGIAVSVMAQYTPAYRALTRDGWDRPVSREEYDRVAEAVAELDFDCGWMQAYEGQAPNELIGFSMEPGSGIS
jgi:putative pyruvate formate lyase activating enzyme